MADEPLADANVYLDACCLNRPFDDQLQLRVRLESESILWLLNNVQLGHWSGRSHNRQACRDESESFRCLGSSQLSDPRRTRCRIERRSCNNWVSKRLMVYISHVPSCPSAMSF